MDIKSSELNKSINL